VALALAKMLALGGWRGVELGQFVPYLLSSRQKCDLWVGKPSEWVIEAKMARFRGDSGEPDDTAIKDVEVVRDLVEL
jgi:hypothetical protein